jgi:hypothetical protein
MVTLDPNQQSTLAQASRLGIERAFQQIRSSFPHGAWMDAGNRYRADPVAGLRHDVRASRINHRDLAQYIAASVILHCADGWGYLGRAIDCHARGDGDTALHMGYYAELRATLSLLASEGIGIFSRQHFVVTAAGHCVELPVSPRSPGRRGGADLGTHQITWLTLDYWASLQRSTDLLAEVISPGGIRLDDWLNAFLAGFNVQHIAQDWLNSWGLDLKRLSNDREARNEASYQPTRLRPRAYLSALDASHFMRELWTICQPGIPSRFEFLDRHLVRLSLERAYRATAPSFAFPAGVSGMLRSIAPNGRSADEWRDFFTRGTESQTPMAIAEAGGTVPSGHARHHVQVLSRAAILLRLASGACVRLLQAVGVQRSDLAFWWKPFGEHHGLWRPGEEPLQFADLWEDIELALDDMYAWETGPE